MILAEYQEAEVMLILSQGNKGFVNERLNEPTLEKSFNPGISSYNVAGNLALGGNLGLHDFPHRVELAY